MHTYLDCLPCFLKQTLEAARIAGVDEAVQKKLLNKVLKEITRFPLTASPPEMGRIIYRLVREISGKDDPFKEIKKRSNQLALNLYPKLKKRVRNSEDKLLAAVELAIAGNVIDYGVKNSLDIEKELEEILGEDFPSANKKIFEFEEFRNDLEGVSSLLYLADNAGEIVFDKILIEELKELNKEIVFALRNEPVINDALKEDAYDCGIDKYARIVSNGSDAPGTILKFCSDEFLKLYQNAEMVISKGQGNFEALSTEKGRIYFLFKVKCPVLAKDIGCELGSMVLKKAGFSNGVNCRPTSDE